MPYRRKTVNVADLVKETNRILRESTCSAEMRKGVMITMENILMDTKNYRGFRYLTPDEVPAGHLPGINTAEHGQFEEDYEKRFANTDSSRVNYYFS